MLHQLVVPLRAGGEARVQLPYGQARLMAMRLRGLDWSATAFNCEMSYAGAIGVARIVRRKLLAVGIDTPLLDTDRKGTPRKATSPGEAAHAARITAGQAALPCE